ncbi:MAG: alpha-glucan family phosphorylase [Candidatus Omnitrophota bacterium]|jgi:starch phosphorylase
MAQDQLVEEFLSLVRVEDYESVYKQDIIDGKYFGMPLGAIIASERRLRLDSEKTLAYFSMEYGLATSFYNKFMTVRPINAQNEGQENDVFSNYQLADYLFSLRADTIIDLPIYSGGLGVLAGDTLKTMADYKMAAVGVGMLWHSGYFRQKFWYKYGQQPEKMQWDPRTYPGLIPLQNRVKISLKSGEIHLKLWKYYVYSYTYDYAVPLILLDADIEPNSEKIRGLTDQLYKSSDVWVKLLQRVVLGMGGVAAVEDAGYHIDAFHMNEGQAVFAFVAKARGLAPVEIEKLKEQFIYTCHTPVEAGHDRFSFRDLEGVFKKEDIGIIDRFGRQNADTANLTLLAMNIASSTNAVSWNHQQVMHQQFPEYKERIKYVTNGVHPHTWISERFMKLFGQFPEVFKDFRANPFILVHAGDLREDREFRGQLWNAHQGNKEYLCALLEKWKFKKDVFTVCWARRWAAYKRPSLILQDIERLVRIAREIGPLQIIFAGKAHPNDNMGRLYINEMLEAIDSLEDEYDILKIIALENYDIAMAKTLVSGSDVWLNNPLPPFEASGTSGMKAILNGVVQISTYDGWIAEAADRDIGMIFGYRNGENSVGSEMDLHLDDDSEKLYTALEAMVKLYYQTNRAGNVDIGSHWIDMMINCLVVGGYFNTYRMLDEYKYKIFDKDAEETVQVGGK